MADIQLASNCFATRQITKIIQIGCGGTGSLIVPNIARALADIKRNRVINYVLIDGDKVEEKNIIRQNFVAPDVGSYKSDVLARRYSCALGIDISSMSKYVSNYEDINIPYSGCLVVSCVDNNRTRELIAEGFERYNCVWIDAGNELLGGQVFISSQFREDGYEEETNIMKIHPEMLIRKDKLPTELSCAERVSSGEQSLGVNLTAATILFNAVNSFIREQKVYYYEIDFTAKNSFTKKMLDTYPKE